MKIVLKTKNLKLTPSLERFINEKINSLEKFLEILGTEKNYYGNFFGKGKPKTEAWVEVEKTTLHHQKGEIFRAECQLHLPKQSIRAVVRSEDLKIAINELKDKLQRELREYKNKLIVARRKEEGI